MQLSLRPYVTAGVAIVGASVIAIAPIRPTPPEVHIPNPIPEIARGVQLTANEPTAGQMIETQYNDLALQITQLGLSLTVPLTATLIEALGVDTMGLPPDAAATVLLLGLSGYAISGVGSIGSALGGVIDGFGCPSTGGLCGDVVNGYLALLVGAPSTLIEGFVLGGFGPDLSGVLKDAGVPIGGEVFAGGLIQNPGLFQTPLFPGLQVCLPGLGCGSNLQPGDRVLPSFFFTAGTLLTGLISSLGSSNLLGSGGSLGEILDNFAGLNLFNADSANAADLTSTNIVEQTDNKLSMVGALTPGEEARGKHAAPDTKHAAPDTTFAAPARSFPDQAAVSTQQFARALEAPRTRNSDFGKAVKAAAEPDNAPSGITAVRDSLSFVPETGKKNGGNSGNSNLDGTKISSPAKGFDNAVKHAVGLGGGSTHSDSE
jgi:hypothetical protein